MLVLTRKAGESVRIGADVRVTVVSASGGQVRIGIEAPGDVRVHREEVYERIARANLDAAQLAPEVLERIEPPSSGRGGSAMRPARSGRGVPRGEGGRDE